MKIKKIERKLNLKKETITNLGEKELDHVVGGRTKYCSIDVSCTLCLTIEETCPSCTIC